METTKITEIIEKAINILKGHDFYYMMVDNGYERAMERAKLNMRRFVEVTNNLPEELREAFRNLWTATHAYCACFRPMWTSPNADEKKAAKEEAQTNLDKIIAQFA